MKRITLKSVIVAAAMLLGSAQSASAWGFKASTWGGADDHFTGATNFYANGYTSGAGLDVYTVTFDAAQTAFGIYQEGDDDSKQNLYVSELTLAAGSVVRATAWWNIDHMENTYTVALPNGKVYVTPAGGSAVEMTKQTSGYVYTAVLAHTTSVTISGDDVSSTIHAYNGATNAPASLKLNLPNVPVDATAGKIKVTYNLLTNQVTTENLVSEYCNFLYTSDATASNKNVLFTWETLGNGNVEISIAPGEGTATATFRGEKGMRPDGYKVNGVRNGEVGNANANTFFASTLNAEKTKITLIPQQVIPDGAIISFHDNPALLEWSTEGNGNEYTWDAPFTSYTYGSNCTGVYVSKLDMPTNVAINASNVLTFNEVMNADNYIVIVKIGGTVLKSFNVSGSGETLSLPFGGTFNVTVTASSQSNYANSDASAPYTWNLTATNGDPGISIFCDYSTNYTDDNQPHFTFETANVANGNIQVGDLVITIDGTNASYRNLGVRLGNFTVAGIPGTSIFTKVSGNLESPAIFRPISGLTIAAGTAITYSGELEYICGTNTNGYGGRTFSNYLYGSACTAPQLDAPTNLALSANNELTFTPDVNAGSTTVVIMLGETTLQTISNFASGTAISFPINGSFTIKARSMAGSTAYQNSEYSTSYATLVVNIADANLTTNSAYCEWELNPQEGGNSYPDDSDVAYFTWKYANGNIVVEIKGTEVNLATTAFREPGIDISNVLIGGVEAPKLLSKVYGNSAITFTPVAGITIPKGTSITYNGYVTYRVIEPDGDLTTLDDLYPTVQFNYTYGTGCPTVPTETTTITNEKNITVFAHNRTVVAQFEKESSVALYNAVGQAIYVGTANGKFEYNVNAAGIYMLSINGAIYKIAIK